MRKNYNHAVKEIVQQVRDIEDGSINRPSFIGTVKFTYFIKNKDTPVGEKKK